MYNIIALIGKAGSGKDTVLQAICKKHKTYNEIVSCTTRPMREGEKNGINYWFLSDDEFISGMNDGQFLETSSFNGWFYGTHLDYLDENRVNIGVFNPEGIRNLLKNDNIKLTVFWITASDKVRMLRQLTREEAPNVDEIVRRWGTDKNDFSYIDFEAWLLPNEGSLDEAVEGFEAKFLQS